MLRVMYIVLYTACRAGSLLDLREHPCTSAVSTVDTLGSRMVRRTADGRAGRFFAPRLDGTRQQVLAQARGQPASITVHTRTCRPSPPWLHAAAALPSERS